MQSKAPVVLFKRHTHYSTVQMFSHPQNRYSPNHVLYLYKFRPLSPLRRASPTLRLRFAYASLAPFTDTNRHRLRHSGSCDPELNQPNQTFAAQRWRTGPKLWHWDGFLGDRAPVQALVPNQWSSRICGHLFFVLKSKVKKARSRFPRTRI